MEKENLQVVHNAAVHRFEMDIEGKKALVNYRPNEDGTFTLYHAEVPPEFEGRGFGAQLVKGTLEQLKTDGIKFIATCPFIVAYLRRHPEYQEFSAR